MIFSYFIFINVTIIPNAKIVQSKPMYFHTNKQAPSKMHMFIHLDSVRALQVISVKSDLSKLCYKYNGGAPPLPCLDPHDTRAASMNALMYIRFQIKLFQFRIKRFICEPVFPVMWPWLHLSTISNRQPVDIVIHLYSFICCIVDTTLHVTIGFTRLPLFTKAHPTAAVEGEDKGRRTRFTSASQRRVEVSVFYVMCTRKPQQGAFDQCGHYLFCWWVVEQVVWTGISSLQQYKPV